MVKADIKRSKKLVSFRELERDRASMELVSARARSDSAKNAVKNQRKLLEKEQRDALNDKSSIYPNDIILSLACIEAAQEELRKRESLLDEAEKNLQEKSEHLLATHQKVRQMETLLQQVQLRNIKEEDSKEQREIDDLATNREARK